MSKIRVGTGDLKAYKQSMTDYQRIEKAILFIDTHKHDQPSLAVMAKAAGMSEFHFQRVFTRWAGISPKRFLQFLTANYARQRLLESRSVLDSTFACGLSSPSRLHDLLVTVDAMTPGEVKLRGAGLKIWHGLHATPFGLALLATTGRGVCGLTFLSDSLSEQQALAELKCRWPQAEFIADSKNTGDAAKKIFGARGELKILLRGSPFQIKVWEALLKIPPGHLASYKDLATIIGAPRASRAVGTAIGENAIGYLIPCHRVIRETGVIGGYRWGTQRKKAMIAFEAALARGESNK